MAKKEKQEAVLTEAEKKRLAQFEAMSEEMVGKGMECFFVEDPDGFTVQVMKA